MKSGSWKIWIEFRFNWWIQIEMYANQIELIQVSNTNDFFPNCSTNIIRLTCHLCSFPVPNQLRLPQRFILTVCPLIE